MARRRWKQKHMTPASVYTPGGHDGPVTITRPDGTTETVPAKQPAAQKPPKRRRGPDRDPLLGKVEPYRPGPDRGFIPRNQRNAQRDERGRLVSDLNWRDECRSVDVVTRDEHPKPTRKQAEQARPTIAGLCPTCFLTHTGECF
jgi:hypothetical protein